MFPAVCKVTQYAHEINITFNDIYKSVNRVYEVRCVRAAHTPMLLMLELHGLTLYQEEPNYGLPVPIEGLPSLEGPGRLSKST